MRMFLVEERQLQGLVAAGQGCGGQVEHGGFVV